MKKNLLKELLLLKTEIESLYLNTEEGQRCLLLNVPFEVELENNCDIIKCKFDGDNCYLIGNFNLVSFLQNNQNIFHDIYTESSFKLIIQINNKEYTLNDEKLYDFFKNNILDSDIRLIKEVRKG